MPDDVVVLVTPVLHSVRASAAPSASRRNWSPCTVALDPAGCTVHVVHPPVIAGPEDRPARNHDLKSVDARLRPQYWLWKNLRRSPTLSPAGKYPQSRCHPGRAGFFANPSMRYRRNMPAPGFGPKPNGETTAAAAPSSDLRVKVPMMRMVRRDSVRLSDAFKSIPQSGTQREIRSRRETPDISIDVRLFCKRSRSCASNFYFSSLPSSVRLCFTLRAPAWCTVT